MNDNFLYKCTDCGTVYATSEDLGESTWLLSCLSIRCQGMVKEFFRLDFIPHIHNKDVEIVCRKEVMGDDSDEGETEKINVHRS
jgi:hypothetical protein